MFELLDLILTSPLGAAILAELEGSLYALIVLSDCDECGFNDLGKLLFGGVILAVLAGVGLSLLIRRMKEKNPTTSVFVTIRSSDHRE